MARNYAEDQLNEVEALDSIYCGEMEILEEAPNHKFKIPISTTDFNETGDGLSCQLVFQFTPKYPDEAPLLEVEDPINFENNYESSLLENMKETIEENLGMEMIFSLVSSAQEFLNCKYDEIKSQEEADKLKKKQALEEAERKKFEGTKVTVESFLNWRNQFELEMGIAQKREKENLENRKLTGKELFLQDTTLNDSDIKFLISQGDSIENVKIDESLFQNLGELDLGDDDDDSEDEDWVPGKDD